MWLCVSEASASVGFRRDRLEARKVAIPVTVVTFEHSSVKMPPVCWDHFENCRFRETAIYSSYSSHTPT